MKIKNFKIIHDNSKKNIYKIKISDSNHSKSSDENVTLCPINYNVITKDQSQKELLFNILEKIKESEIKTKFFHKLKSLLLQDKIIASRIQSFSLRQIAKTYEGQSSNLSKPITVKELKIHIEKQNLLEESNSILISPLQELENLVPSLESSKSPNQSPPFSPKLSPENQNHGSFLSVINRIDFQKSYVILIKEFKFHSIALLNSDVNMNCIQDGLIPSNYFEKPKDK